MGVWSLGADGFGYPFYCNDEEGEGVDPGKEITSPQFYKIFLPNLFSDIFAASGDLE
jgi:hypothetical protein